MPDPRDIAGADAISRAAAEKDGDEETGGSDLGREADADAAGADFLGEAPPEILPEPDDSRPVFDRADDLPLPVDDDLPVDDENNVLPGNDPEDDDPNDNGADEQNDPEDQRAKLIRGQPIE